MPTFSDLKSEYARLWTTMEVRPERETAVTLIAQKLLRHKAIYVETERATGVPWFVVAALHNRESGADFATYLGNREPLTRETRLVPKGRGPFDSWQAGAIDALKLDRLDQVSEWTPERACYEIEKFNGFGYQKKGIPSPYLWSFSNNYEAGKYVADGVFDATAVDKQCGAIPVLKRLMKLDTTARFTDGIKVKKPIDTGVIITAGGGAVATAGAAAAAAGVNPAIIAAIVIAIGAAVIAYLICRRTHAGS